MAKTVKLKTVYIITLDGADFQGAFSEDGELITYWSENDAMWRHEYFESLINFMGYKTGEPSKKQWKAFNQELREIYGEDL